MVYQSDIIQLKEGKEEAFRKVYDVLGEKVYQLAFRFLKNECLSEEIVQESFLKLWLNRQSLDDKGNIWLYLYVIAKRLCLNKIREIKKSQALFDELMVNIHTLGSPVNIPLEIKEMEAIIGQAIAHLPQQQQIIFNLSREEGLSYKEIAERLHISPNTVKNHMVQALKNLKNSMQESGYTSLLLFISTITLSC